MPRRTIEQLSTRWKLFGGLTEDPWHWGPRPVPLQQFPVSMSSFTVLLFRKEKSKLLGKVLPAFYPQQPREPVDMKDFPSFKIHNQACLPAVVPPEHTATPSPKRFKQCSVSFTMNGHRRQSSERLDGGISEGELVLEPRNWTLCSFSLSPLSGKWPFVKLPCIFKIIASPFLIIAFSIFQDILVVGWHS